MSPTHRYRRFSSVPIRQAWRRAVAVLASVGLVLGLAVASGLGSGVANAAGGAIYNVKVNTGTTYTTSGGAVPVVTEDAEATLHFEYDLAARQTPALEATFTLPNFAPASTAFTGIAATCVPGNAPAGNDAINCVGYDATTRVLTVKFKDAAAWPTGVVTGEFDAKFKYTNVSGNSSGDVNWTAGLDNGKATIIVREKDTPLPPNANALSKSGTDDGTINNSLTLTWNAVTNKYDVVVDNNIEGKQFSYTLLVDVGPAAASTYTITDTLNKYLEYVNSASGVDLKVTLFTPKSGNPLELEANTALTLNNHAVTAAPAGDSFTLTNTDLGALAGSTSGTLPAHSQLKIEYKAKVESGAAAGLKTELEKAANQSEGPGGLTVTYNITNTASATLGSDTKSASKTFKLTESIGGVDVGKAYGKKANWSKRYLDFDPATGNPIVPVAGIPVTYTLDAKLAGFTGGTKYQTLTGDVVLVDTLPAGVEWNTAPTPYITMTSEAGSSLALGSDKGACAATVDAFISGGASAGDYCVSTDKRTLMINVGQNKTTNVHFAVEALIKTLPAPTTQSGTGFDLYTLTNTLQLSFATAAHTTRYTDLKKTVDVELINRKDRPGDGYHDTSRFSKTTPATTTAKVGETAKVPYTFVIDPTAIVNPAEDPTGAEELNPDNLTIVDDVDPNIFDLSVAPTVEGSYGSTTLVASDFVVTADPATGRITIKLSPAGQGKVTFDPVDSSTWKVWTVKLTLTTIKFTGKQTLHVTNKAWLEGSKRLYWDDESSQATSYGDEAEVLKTVWDGSDWVSTFVVPSSYTANEFFYRIQFIPHGNYGSSGGATPRDINDVLPDGLTFVRFVTDAEVGTNLSAEPAKSTDSKSGVGGNFNAKFDASVADGPTVKLTLDGHTYSRTDNNGIANVYFVVRTNKALANDVPVANTAGLSTATIVKSNGYPLIIQKVDSSDDVTASAPTVITDRNARFTLTNTSAAPDSTNTVLDGIFVCDGLLAVGADCASAKTVTVSSPGVYYLHEIVPPTSPKVYKLSAEVLKITVVAGKTPSSLVFANDPVDAAQHPSVCVGDRVWVDTNKDGLQNIDSTTGKYTEPGIGGVWLTISKVDALGVESSVTGVNGLSVGPTVTDSAGNYMFCGLPPLLAGEHYKVSIDQAKSASVLAPYVPTTASVGGDRGSDSSTNSALTVYPLRATGDKVSSPTEWLDPTLDFGFVLKPSTGGGGGGATTSPTPTVTTTPTSPAPTTTKVPSTTPTIPTVTPTSGTGATTPPPPTNVPAITTSVPEPNQCVDLVEHGFVPGETVTITITGPDGQYTITAVADENGDVAFCLKSAVPVRVTIEVLGENHVVVREVALGIGGELPNTGVPTATYLTWALLLLGAGAALVLAGRRGRKSKHISR